MSCEKEFKQLEKEATKPLRIMVNTAEDVSERALFGGRWLLAPLYLGLMFSLIPVLYRFFAEFISLFGVMTTADMHELTLRILEMLDTVLLGNLVIIVIFAGYENFVSKINVAENVFFILFFIILFGKMNSKRV